MAANYGLFPDSAMMLLARVEQIAHELTQTQVVLARATYGVQRRIDDELIRTRLLLDAYFATTGVEPGGSGELVSVDRDEAAIARIENDLREGADGLVQAVVGVDKIRGQVQELAASFRDLAGAEPTSRPSTESAARFYFEIGDPVQAVRLMAAAQDLIRSLAFDASESVVGTAVDEIQAGSIWIRFKKAMQTLVAKEDAQEILDQTRQGLEASLVERAQSENVMNLSTAIAKIMNASGDAASVSIDAGPFLIAKITDEDGESHWRAKARSSREIARENLSDKMLQNPRDLFKAIGGGEDIRSMPTDVEPT